MLSEYVNVYPPRLGGASCPFATKSLADEFSIADRVAVVRITVTAKGRVTAKVIPVKKRKERTTDGR